MYTEHKTIPCSVTQELVDAVKAKVKKSRKGGHVSTEDVLYLLGFQLADFEVIKDVYVRNPERPYEVYQTDIYNGRLRFEEVFNEVTKKMSKTGKLHFLSKAYLDNSVLNINHIPATFMHNIINIGEE